MPRHIYCSYCGMELEQFIKTLKNKGIFVHTVKPHECDEQYVENITDAEAPQSAFAREMAEAQDKVAAANQQKYDDNLLAGTPDKRSPDHLRKPITSSAPLGVLGMVNSATPGSAKEREMIDLDKQKEGEDSET